MVIMCIVVFVCVISLILSSYSSGYFDGYDSAEKMHLQRQWTMTDKVKETNIFDSEETIPNCTVQVLRNSVTGEVSVGWYRNVEEDDLK